MIGFEPGFEARVVADDVTFTLPEYLLQAALDASYAAKDHTHTADQISGLDGALGSYLTKTDAANTYQQKLTGAAGSDDVSDTDRFIWRKTSDNSILTTSWWNVKEKLKKYLGDYFLALSGGRLKGGVSVQTADTNGVSALVSGDDAHTGYLAGILPNGQRGWYVGWAPSNGRVVMSAENGTQGFEVVGDFKVSMGFESYGNGSTRGVFRNTGAGDSWIQFFARDAAGWYSEFGQRSNGAAYIWTNGQEFRFQTNGQFWSAGDLVARGVVYAANGNGVLHGDGNVQGAIWSQWGSPYAFSAINNQIEKRAREYAEDRSYQRARKMGSWDDVYLNSHEQRWQNGTGENLVLKYALSGIQGTYMYYGPDNVNWKVFASAGQKSDTGTLILPPGWWIRLTRISGSYSFTASLTW